MAQDTIKVHRMKELPIVVGELNGKRAYFLVDTGASITILNQSDAQRLKIRYRKSISKSHVISGVVSNHNQSILVAVNAKLYLNGRKIDACFKILNLTNIKNSIRSSSGIWISGIIGSDIMIPYNFVIDYSTQEIRFTHFSYSGITCL